MNIMEKIRHQMLNMLAVELGELNIEDVSVGRIDKQKHYRVLELVTALSLNLSLWTLLPSEILERTDAHRYNREGSFRYPDYGVDCANLDLSTTCQVKWRSGHPLPFSELGTFFAYSSILKAKTLVLATNDDAKLSPPVRKLLESGMIHAKMTPMEIRKWCMLSRGIDVSQLLTEKSLTVEDKGIAPKVIIDFGDEAIKQEISPPTPSEIIKLQVERQEISNNTSIVNLNKIDDLRLYQREAANAILHAISAEERDIRVRMACGTGKTIVIVALLIHWLQSDPTSKWLVVVSSRVLLYQVYRTLVLYGMKVGIIGDKKISFGDVTVTTYHSVERANMQAYSGIIVDEAHHFVDALDDPDAPGVYRHKIAGITCGFHVSFSASLNDDEKIVYDYPITKGIEEQYLTDYEVVVPVFTGTNRKKAIAKLVKERTEWMRILAYCNTHAAAEEFCMLLTGEGIPHRYLTHMTKMPERVEIIEQLESRRIRVIVSINTLAEGVNIRGADTSLLVDQRNSQIDITQCLGRVLRLHPEKPIARIVLPCVDEDRMLSRFLRILGSIDERVASALTDERPGRINLVQCNDGVEDAELNYVEVYHRLSLMGKTTWEVKCSRYGEHTLANGLRPKTTSTDPVELTLAIWGSKQKTKRNNGELTEKQIMQLNQTPGWSWDDDQVWDENCDAVIAIAKETGKPPPVTADAAIVNGRSIKLGHWCNNQRQFQKAGSLTEYQIARLNTIKGWYWVKRDWNQVLMMVKEFVRIYGRIPMQTKNSKEEMALGQWCNAQRRSYRNGTLSSAREAALQEISIWYW